MNAPFSVKQLLYLSCGDERTRFDACVVPQRTYYLLYVRRGTLKVRLDDAPGILRSGDYLLSDTPAQILIESDHQADRLLLSLQFVTANAICEEWLGQIAQATNSEMRLLENITEEYLEKRLGYQDFMLCDLTMFLVYVFRNQPIRESKDKPTAFTSRYQEELIDKCLHLIDKNLSDPELNVHYLTEQLFISPAYLHRLFQKYVHTSINKYIQNVRLEKAQDLLENSILSVTEISEALGFCSQCYFSSQFKKKMQMTPSEFRMKQPS